MEITKDMISDDMQLIDIRDLEDYEVSHIKGAIYVPLQKIVSTPYQVMTKNKKYVLYCDKGSISKKVCNILNSQGYQVYNLSGGYEKWKEK